MAETFNEALFDAMIRHQTGLLRYSGSVRNRVWALLDATEADLKQQIRDQAARAGTDSPRRVRELNSLLEKLHESRLKGWKEARAVWFAEMRALARAEPGFFDRIFAASFPGVELGTVLPDPERLRQIVTSHPFEGKVLREWADDLESADLKRIEQALKVGLVQGENPQQISRRVVGTGTLDGVDGVTEITRRQAATVVRTATNGIAAEARREYALLNSDLAPFEVFTATLDSRTTPICRAYDGQRFKVGEGPRLPLHMNERSIYSPVVDGEVIGDRPYRSFTERQLLREFSAESGLDSVPLKRADLPRGTKSAYDAFARKRMRELTGTTPARTTYNEFLWRQSAEFQKDLLGPTRAALFRRGELELSAFVEPSGRVLTLAELAERHTDAFLRAGLDPARFAA